MHARTLVILAAIPSVFIACDGGSGAGDSTPIKAEISDVQGAGATSPLEGATIQISGIVSGDFQDNDADGSSNLGGFFVQSINADADPATSEGIFVFDGSSPAVDVNVGDQVTVVGEVTEHFGETQVSASQVEITGTGQVQAFDVNLPLDQELESFEGMLLRLPQSLTVVDHYNLERFGSVKLYAGERPFSFTNQKSPDVAGYAQHQANFAARTILLDDGRREENVHPIRLLNASAESGYSLRSGDTITGVTGNLRFSRGSGSAGSEDYRLMPTTEPQFVTGSPRPEAPAKTGSLRVVGFNTLNFFSSIDTGADNCGPNRNSGCRGADSAEELERQLAKLVTVLRQIDADIISLMEVENNGGIALQLLVDRLNAAGPDLYDFVDTGFIGDDVISTAYLYNTGTVSLVGDSVTIDSTVDDRFSDRLNRPSLAQAFEVNASGATLSVVVNHLKSKGSDCDDFGDPNLGDGQGNCNATRTAAASALADWIAGDPTGSGDPDYLIIGDLNAHVYEDPLIALESAGFTNLLEAAVGGNTWTLIFRGQSGALDHALANPTLLPQVTAVVDWHINADEPNALDYNLDFGRDPSIFNASSPARSSDHDPIIVDLELNP